MRIESIEPLLTKDEKQKIELLEKLIKDNVNIQAILTLLEYRGR